MKPKVIVVGNHVTSLGKLIAQEIEAQKLASAVDNIVMDAAAINNTSDSKDTDNRIENGLLKQMSFLSAQSLHNYYKGLEHQYYVSGYTPKQKRKKFHAMAVRGPKFLPPTSRNKQCPCGSGKKYKRCCGK